MWTDYFGCETRWKDPEPTDAGYLLEREPDVGWTIAREGLGKLRGIRKTNQGPTQTLAERPPVSDESSCVKSTDPKFRFDFVVPEHYVSTFRDNPHRCGRATALAREFVRGPERWNSVPREDGLRLWIEGGHFGSEQTLESFTCEIEIRHRRRGASPAYFSTARDRMFNGTGRLWTIVREGPIAA